MTLISLRSPESNSEWSSKIYIYMGFVKSIVSRATLNVIYGNGKVPTCIKSVTSLIIPELGLNVQH